MEEISNLSVFDYERKKLCDLYDSQMSIPGQAFQIRYTRNSDGIDQISFNIPYMVEKEKSFRWDFLKNEYLIRLYHNGKEVWFVANKPTKSKNKGELIGSVTCNSTAILLKTKNIYMEFDDENGIGTVDYLMNQILMGTGWSLGYCEALKEADGTTDKVRSLNVTGNTGALGLIQKVCALFQCRPVYHTDTKTIDIYSIKNRDMIFEAEVGRNLDALGVTTSSDDIVTRLYVEGEYGDHGYVGIDDVNPTGLTYLMNFDYYREIGVFTQRHEEALATYLRDIQDVVARIKTNQASITLWEGEANDRIGQCKLTVYYTAQGFTMPMYLYGDPTPAQQNLGIGDEVVILNQNGTHRYETIISTIQALLQTGDYAVAKFATKAAGSIGAKEVQVEAKEKEITSLYRKKDATTKPDKKAEYQREIDNLEDEIEEIYESNDGLYKQMSDMMKVNGVLDQIKGFTAAQSVLRQEQDQIEAVFIAAMGNMLRDGKWQNNNYIVGQEEALLADAQERMNIMSRPSATYTFDYIRMTQDYGVPIEDIQINAIVRTNDDELDIHENLFVTKIVSGIDEKKFGTIDVSNQDITLSTSDLGSLLSRMSQLADLIDQKNTIYNRAEAISKSGTFYADRLNGMIDVVKNQIVSSVSNWYTDDSGNMIFISADGGSAMMLSGAGFLLADSKLEDGSWNWRLCGTGHGISADEITAGFISADRIEAGSISTEKVTANFGTGLTLSGNPSITGLNNSVGYINDQMAANFVPNTEYAKGDIVRYGNKLYVFTADYHGDWAHAPATETSVSGQVSSLNGSVDTMASQYADMSGKYTDMSGKYTDMNNLYDEMEQQYETIGSQYETISGQYNTISGQYETISGQYDTMADQYETISGQYNTISDQYTTMSGQYTDMSDKYTDMAVNSYSVPTFSTTVQYKVGDYVKHQDADGVLRVYVFTSAHKGAWNTSHVQETTSIVAMASSLNSVSDTVNNPTSGIDALNSNVTTINTAISDAGVIAVPEFNYQTAYKAGDYVRRNGKVYVFVNDHHGGWIASDVVESTSLSAIGAGLGDVQSGLGTVQTDLGTVQSDLGTVQSDIGTIQDAIGDPNTGLSALDSKIGDVSGDIATINNQLADEFVENRQYHAGDFVLVNGIIYVFTEDYRGTWAGASGSVAETNIASKLAAAQSTAQQANTTAGQASATAQQANATAEAASTTAGQANATAEQANTTAGQANATAEAANTTAGQANATAQQANTTAGQASAAAQQANTTAQQASTTADQANATAQQANTTAGQANATAEAANTTAGQANATAQQANTTAGQANATAQTANGRVTTVISQIADEFDASQEYKKGDLVRKDDIVYVITADHASGVPWENTSKAATKLSSQIDAIHEDVDDVKQQVAEDFDATKDYHPGDIVRFPDEGRVYLFVKEHTHGTTVTSDQVIVTNVGAQVANISSQLGGELFSTDKNYKAGDIVMYLGDRYVFTQDKAAGNWNPNVVSLTNVTTEMQLLPDRIIQYVGSKGYTKTYIQMTDPLLDPDKNVAIGDYWIVANSTSYIGPTEWGAALVADFDPEVSYRKNDAVRYNRAIYIFTQAHTGAWNNSHVRVKTTSDRLPINADDPSVRTWGMMQALNWGVLSGYCKMLVWSGEEWLTVYDTSQQAMAFTRIEQNKNAIAMEAERANAAEGKLHAEILLTADEVRLETEQKYTTKAFFRMTADGKIQLTSVNFSSLGNVSSGLYITPTMMVLNSGGSMTVNSGGSMTVNSGGGMTVKSGGSMTVNSGGSMTVNSGGNMTINSGGNLTISSGGNFSLTSTNFSVTTAGVITATSGTIGSWSIKSNQLYSSSGTTKVVLDSSTNLYPLPGGSTNTNMYAFWCGADAPNDAPFSVTKDGIATIKKLRVQTASDTYQDIDFSNFITAEDLSDYDFSAAMGKLKFQTVKSINKDSTGKVTIVTTTGTGGGSKTVEFDG